MSEIYAKLSSDLPYSSMWEEDGDTCKLWVTFLALKDHQGIVKQNVTGLARICKLSLAKCQEAIAKFEAPDDRSSTPTDDGRRLKRLEEGGWLVINHEKYRELGWSEEKKEYERRRKAAYRARKNGPPTLAAEDETGEVTRTMVLKWRERANANGADYTEKETLDAWLYFVRSGWIERGTRVTDYRAALEEKIQRERKYADEREKSRGRGKENPRNKGIARGPDDPGATARKRAEAQEMARQVARDKERALSEPAKPGA